MKHIILRYESCRKNRLRDEDTKIASILVLSVSMLALKGSVGYPGGDVT